MRLLGWILEYVGTPLFRGAPIVGLAIAAVVFAWPMVFAAPLLALRSKRREQIFNIGCAALAICWMSIAFACLEAARKHPTTWPHLSRYFASASRRTSKDYVAFGTNPTAVHSVSSEPITDGAVCAAYETLEDLEMPASEVGTAVVVLDSNDSRKTIAVRKRKIAESEEPEPTTEHHSVMGCSSIIPGTDQGLGALWRRTGGRLALWVVDLPFWLGTMGTVALFAAFVVVPGGLVATLCVLIVGFVRAVRIIAHSLRVPTSRAWTPAKEHIDEPLIVQCSDLHVSTGSPYELTQDPSAWAGAGLPNTSRRFAALAHEISKSRAEGLVITGDVTDLGRADEWALVMAAVKPIRQQLGAIPGNHDVSINPGYESDLLGSKRKERQAAFRAQCGCEYPARVVLHSGRATLLLLDSNQYRSHYVLSNAVGMLGRSQIDAVAKILGEMRKNPTPVIVALHHHVAFRERDAKLPWPERVMNRFKVVLDGQALIEHLKRYREDTSQPVLCIHGHQHETYQEQLGEGPTSIQIYGHPSSTMGDLHNGVLDGKCRYSEIGIDAQGNWTIQTQAFAVEQNDDVVKLSAVGDEPAANS